MNGSQGVRYVRDNARIAEFIDHTLLKAEATRADIDQLCSEALEHEFAAVCVNPVWVPHCAARLQGSRVAVATVVGFPLGANQSEIKAAETSLAVRQGATEIDMVAAVGHIKGSDWNHVADDIAAVVRAAAGRLDGRSRGTHATRGRRLHGRKGLGRRSRLRDGASHDRQRRNADWHLERRGDGAMPGAWPVADARAPVVAGFTPEAMRLRDVRHERRHDEGSGGLLTGLLRR
jgi:hypothetical protein